MGFKIYGRKCDSPKYEEIIDLSVKTLILFIKKKNIIFSTNL
jgi:hypothetical protein